MENEGFKKLFNRDELRRLEKAAREKNKKHLLEWAAQYDEQLRNQYDNAYKEELLDAIDNFMLAIIYSLHFSEITKFGNKRIQEFCDDMLVTVDMFRKGEYKPSDYKEALEKEGVFIYKSRDKSWKRENENEDKNKK